MSKEKYKGSPREAANNRIESALQDLGDIWVLAYRDILVTRGNRIGLLKRSPVSSTLHNGASAVLWHAYEDAMCELNAAQFGFFPNKSYGGTISAMMWCREENAKEAYDVLLSALYNEAKRKTKGE